MASANQGNPETAASVYEFTAKDIKGNDVSMEKYRGHGEYFELEFVPAKISILPRDLIKYVFTILWFIRLF